MTLTILVLAAADLTSAVGGAMLCAETRGLEGRVGARAALRERAAIVEVARGRARESGRSLTAEILRPGQFATFCRSPADGQALARVFRDVLRGKIKAPRWSRRARAFATAAASRRVGKAWRRVGLLPISGTGTVHVFWRFRGGRGWRTYR